MSKPRVLVLGGMGFIGRNVLVYLVENNLTSFLRVVDKQVPSTVYLNPRCQTALNTPGVHFMQANLAKEAAVKNAFTHPDGEFDFVFNCAGITKNGQDDDVYKDNILQISVLAASEAARRNVKRFVELSTAHVYAADKVHVDDVARAIWHVAQNGEQGGIYNVVDTADSTQGSVTDMISALFGIKNDYHGSIVSNLARLNMRDAVEDVNEKHMGPWSDMCAATGVTSTPLSPFIDQELLYNNSLCVDGSKLTATGFQCTKPAPTIEELRACVNQYVEMKLFPPGLMV